MFLYTTKDDQTGAQWTGKGPLTYDLIQAEGVSLWKTRAKARSQAAYDYARDDLGAMLHGLARLALKTDFGGDIDAKDIEALARCVSDYTVHWGEQLEETTVTGWKPGLYGCGYIDLIHGGVRYTYALRYRPHFLVPFNDHFELKLVTDAAKPTKSPNPISETGFRSVFVSSADIDALVSPHSWITRYMNAQALTWEPPADLGQLSLFD